MSQRYALKGPVSGQVITYRGRVLVHDNRAELEFLFPGCSVVPYDGSDPTMPISQHPQMEPVQFPLRKEDFR